MNIPVYDFPHSPILLLGFFGILIALTTLFITYNKYFNSPLNRDKKFDKNSLEIEFKKVLSQLWDGINFNWNFKRLSKSSESLKWIFNSNNLFYWFNIYLF